MTYTNKLKISAVSYLNTKPFIYGFEHTGFDREVELTLDIPSVCADKLLTGAADIGLIPVAVIPKLQNPHIISDYCIGACGAVKTVCVFSEQPIERLRAIYLDYQSRTSVQLLGILLREYFHLTPLLLPSFVGYEEHIKHDVGALVIGDRAIGLEQRYPYTYDLAELWQQLTGLPFVFAAWVANRPIPMEFVERFNSVLAFGVGHTRQVAADLGDEMGSFSLYDYFEKYISYSLDTAKKKALDLFLSKLGFGEVVRW